MLWHIGYYIPGRLLMPQCLRIRMSRLCLQTQVDGLSSDEDIGDEIVIIAPPTATPSTNIGTQAANTPLVNAKVLPSNMPPVSLWQQQQPEQQQQHRRQDSGRSCKQANLTHAGQPPLPQQQQQATAGGMQYQPPQQQQQQPPHIQMQQQQQPPQQPPHVQLQQQHHQHPVRTTSPHVSKPSSLFAPSAFSAPAASSSASSSASAGVHSSFQSSGSTSARIEDMEVHTSGTRSTATDATDAWFVPSLFYYLLCNESQLSIFLPLLLAIALSLGGWARGDVSSTVFLCIRNQTQRGVFIMLWHVCFRYSGNQGWSGFSGLPSSASASAWGVGNSSVDSTVEAWNMFLPTSPVHAPSTVAGTDASTSGAGLDAANTRGHGTGAVGARSWGASGPLGRTPVPTASQPQSTQPHAAAHTPEHTSMPPMPVPGWATQSVTPTVPVGASGGVTAPSNGWTPAGLPQNFLDGSAFSLTSVPPLTTSAASLGGLGSLRRLGAAGGLSSLPPGLVPRHAHW